MNIEEACNYTLNKQLLTQILELETDNNLVTWIDPFLTNQKIQLVINSYYNQIREIKT